MSFHCEPLDKEGLDPRSLFCRAAPQQGSSQPVLLHGVVQSQEEDFAFVLAEHRDVPTEQFLPLVQIPLNHSSVLQHVELLPVAHSGVTHQTDEGALLVVVQVTNKDA